MMIEVEEVPRSPKLVGEGPVPADGLTLVSHSSGAEGDMALERTVRS
jgi:hypothetical protein